MIRKRALHVLAAGAVVFTAACQDSPEPTTPGATPPVAAKQVPDQTALAQAIPGFGGLFLDASGAPTVFLTDPSQREEADRALAPFIRESRMPGLQVRQGNYDYLELDRWFNRISPEALALDGAIFADLDEANNRLLVGVEDAAAAARVRDVVAALGIPLEAVEIQETEPIHQLATLRDRFRPTQGGIQIHFTQYVCTMGFNVSHSAGRSFITNSHCTATQGGTEGTEYAQPTRTVDPTVIAVEADDPEYFKGGVCPRGKKCRYSDSSRALYSADVSSSQGVIAKTTGPNNGDLTVAGAFSILAQDNVTTNFLVGTTVNKVGRTTGWTQAAVSNTCVNTSVSGSQVMQLCQTFVQSGNVIVGGGDSGSPVFQITSGDNVTLVGILWGGSSDNKTFVFSPLKSIQDELGALTAIL